MANGDPIDTSSSVGRITLSGVGTAANPYYSTTTTGGFTISEDQGLYIESTPTVSKEDIDKLNEEILELRWQLACMFSDFKEAMAAVLS